MAKKYNLHLKGYVGGWDFDADYVDYILAKNEGQEVNVLIDSLGGYSNTALSIYAAFKRHGSVNVHFVGMNASAATIASLGAKHISMDTSAMYLVHRCSVAFFKWCSLNSEDMQHLIENLEKQKKDLDKLDANVAAMYARKCKKSPEDLLQLMKEGGWLSSQEALEWGFVDEITEFQEDEPPVIDNATAQAMAAVGIPVPKEFRQEGAWARFMNALGEFFNLKPQITNLNSQIMAKEFLKVQDILKCDALPINEGSVSLSEEQMDAVESAITADRDTIASLQEQVNSLNAEKTNMQAQIDALKKKPADVSQQVVAKKESETPSNLETFVNTRMEAQQLFDMFD